MNIKVESQSRLEGDIDFLLRFGINYSFWSVKLKAIDQSLLHLRNFRISLLGILINLLSHFKLYVKIAITFVHNLYR